LKRLYNPMLFLLSNVPDVEKNLELLMTVLQATADSIKNIKNGIDTFQATVLKMVTAGAGQSPPHPAGGEVSVPAPQPAVKPELPATWDPPVTSETGEIS